MSYPQRSGFTVAELMVSMAVMVILMGGTTSALMLATRALPTGQSQPERIAEIVAVLDQMALDLRYAKSLVSDRPSQVTVTVADRNHGPAGDEVIRYGWAESDGDPLMYTYNGAAGRQLLSDVREFKVKVRDGTENGSSGERDFVIGVTIELKVGNENRLYFERDVMVLNLPDYAD